MQQEPVRLADVSHDFRPEKIMQVHHALVGMSWSEWNFLESLRVTCKTRSDFIDMLLDEKKMQEYIRIFQKVRESQHGGNGYKALQHVLGLIEEEERQAPLKRLLRGQFPWRRRKK